MADEHAPNPTPKRGVSRRGLLGATAGVMAAGGAFALGKSDVLTAQPSAANTALADGYEFYGPHQAGITTPAQDRLHFAAFDVTTTEKSELIGLLKDWTEAAARMSRGEPAGGKDSQSYDAPPSDTGEAMGLPASGLTITFGFGPTLFGEGGEDRFGLADRRPAALTRLPHFPADNLDERRSDGDLCIQACAEDPQVAVHAIRNLSRIAFGRAALRWAQLGFGRTSSTSTAQATPRNLMGFKDGTNNLKREEPEAIDEHVWVPQGRDPREDWLVGGSYLVARRINMHIETWDRAPLREQETIIGRTKNSGAPLSGGEEFSDVNFSLQGRGDEPLIDAQSHVALAHHEHNKGRKLLRRGYNFVDGADDLGRLNGGLFFLAFVTDPRTHYIPLQNTMAKVDLLMEYLEHTGSGLWAVPPGITEGEYVGQSLLG